MSYICNSVVGCGGPAVMATNWWGLNFLFWSLGIVVLVGGALALHDWAGRR